MKIIVGIPARLASTRYPKKPLRMILGKTLIEQVYRRASLIKSNYQFVAICDKELENLLNSLKFNSIMTDKNISRPSLRVAAACETLNLDDDDIIVTVQGDEVLFDIESINKGIELIKDDNIFCVNYVCKSTKDEWNDPNTVKVATNLNMEMIYLSRNQIPSTIRYEPDFIYKQIGILIFKYKNHRKFLNLKPAPLEKVESIELLRALEYGLKVKMIEMNYVKSIDTQEDMDKAEELLKNDRIYKEYFKE